MGAAEVAHKGVTHRDLKPSNTLIDEQGNPHLLDFGLAKLEHVDQSLTADDQILGTPAYMSPEQARGDSRQADPRTDVYSLGVVLFQLLTGELPFRGTFHAVLKQHIQTPAPSTRLLDAKIPVDLDSIVLKCLEKVPQHRFSNAGALAEELERFEKGMPLSFRAQGPIRRYIKWFLHNPDVARETTGIVYIVLGSVFVLWNLTGAATTVAGFYGTEDPKQAVVEILGSIALLGIPLVSIGFGIVKQMRYAFHTS